MSRTLLLASLLLTGCSAKSSDTADWWEDSGDDHAPEADSDTDADNDTGDWGGEDEEGFPMLTPAATDVYVFVANPDRGTVTRISVPSLEVVTVEVGEGPADVRTTSDYRKAVVFDEDSDDVAIVDADTLEVVRVEVRPNLNAMELSPDGRWVVVYRDADLVESGEDEGGGGGVESFNEVSLVDTETYGHFSMVVGQNPRQVKFTDESDMALVVSDAEVALIDLTVAEPEPEMVDVAEDPLDPQVAEEVVVAPGGGYAFVRQYGADDIVVLDLVAADVERLPVGTNPTDLDLTPDGSKAVVVCRGSKELWLLDTADPEGDAQVLSMPDEVLGSLLMTPDGSKGILYTTAALTERYAVWDVAAGTFTVEAFVKPVAGMTVSPTGETLLVFHTEQDEEGAERDAWYGEWALTLMDLDDFRANALVLAAEPTAFAHADDGEKGYFIMEGEPYLVVMDYGSLQADDLELKSLPLHVGTLPTTTWAYVSQTHDLGRISFYQGADGSMETITGFELNGETEH